MTVPVYHRDRLSFFNNYLSLQTMSATNMPIAFVEIVNSTESQGTTLDAREFPALPKDPEWELITTGDTENDLDIVPTEQECDKKAKSDDEIDSIDNEGWIEYAPKAPAPSYVQIASKMTDQITLGSAIHSRKTIVIKPATNDETDNNEKVQNSSSEAVDEDDAMYIAKDKGTQRLHDQAVRKARDRRAIAESRYHLTDGRERYVHSDILISPGNMKRRNHELMKSWKWFSKVGKQSGGRGERKKNASGAMLDYAV
jgi:hypothetical protein